MDALRCLLIVSVCSVVSGEPHGLRAGRREVSGGEPLVWAAVPLHAPVPVVRVLAARPLDSDYEELERPRRARPLDQDDAPEYARRPAPYDGPDYARRPAPYESAEYSRRPVAYESGEYSRRPTAFDSGEYSRRPAAFDSAEYGRGRRPLHAEYEEYSGAQVFEAVVPEPTVLYARPSPAGGYTYRRAHPAPRAPPALAPLPAASAPAPTKTATKNSPVIIKIHKYRIVKD